MEAQVLPVAEVSLGVVTSTYLGGERAAAKEEGSVSETLVALCPTGRLIAFITSSHKAQFLFVEGGPLQDGGELVRYRNSFEGLLDVPRDPDSPKPRPKATAVVILPITFHTQSGSVQRSSIVMVGFSDGYVRGYSRSGQRVFSQLMHLDPVSRLTCMASSTVQKPTPSVNNLVVLYRGCTVCVVEGWSIVEVIKVNVANINIKAAGGGVRKQTAGEEWEEGGGETALPLKYKKWNLKDQTVTNDTALLAHTTPSSFDHLCEASNVAGFDATIRSSPVPEAKLITVGENPMIALYKITKDAGHINMSEVMHVMASKMTSAVLGRLSKAGGWLGWGGGAPKPKPPEEKMEISSNLPMSTNIPDSRRSVLSVCVSPLANLAAAVDGFGRVLLLDCQTLVIRRMWKGYRDAQCGWTLVYDTATDDAEKRRKVSKVGSKRSAPGTSSSKSSSSQDLAGKKKAQCLCIYAPRRGILELWPVQSGSRVAALPIGKGCRLLYASHGSFITSTPDAQETAGGASRQSQQLSAERGGRGRGGELYSTEQGEGARVRDTVLILFPDGKLATVAVPFPALVRLADPTSFDTHLMKKLPLAIQSGESDMIVQVIQCVKSSQSLKKAVDVLIEAYPNQNISVQFLLELIDMSLSRLHPKSEDATLQSLFQYLVGVRQLVQFISALQSLSLTETTPHFTVDKLHQCLSELCGVSSQLSKSTADILFAYFTSFTPQRRVVKEMELKSIVKCFKLPSKIGNVLISSSSSSSSAGHLDEGAESAKIPPQRSGSELESVKGGSGVSRSDSTSDSVLELTLKDGLSNSTLLDLGCTLFLPLLVQSSPSTDIDSLFSQSGFPPAVCMSLLSRVLLNGNLPESNPCALLQRMSDIFSAVLRHHKSHDLLTSTTTATAVTMTTTTSLRSELLYQCSHTHCAGHALLLALLAQKSISVSSSIDQQAHAEEESMDPGEEWEGLESWEPVTAEREEWIRLIHHLEGLTLLSNAVGQGEMRKLPPAPWTAAPHGQSLQEGGIEGEDDFPPEEGEKRRLNIGSLQIVLLGEVVRGGVTAAALEEYGPGLVAHCIAKWFIDNKIPAEFIARLPSDPHDLPDGEYSRVVYQFGPLLRLLPLSLSHQALLVHCAWQAANAKKYQLALNFTSQLRRLDHLSGTVGFLWHYLFEMEIVRTIDAIRKGGAADLTSMEAVSVSRNMFGYLYEMSLFDGNLVEERMSGSADEEETCKDVLIMSRKCGKLCLLEMVDSFPPLSATIARTYFELLLQLEVVFQLQRSINVVSFFPTWLRSALKKGAFKSAWQDQVPVQLQQKRTKFLCECVKGPLREQSSSLKMSSTFTSMALKELRRATPSVSLAHLELAEFDDFVFLLCDLWGLNADGVRVHWVSNLFAAGREGLGKKIFLAIDDKTKAAPELLSLAGFLCDHMIKTMENKTEELALLAQTPPTLHQWMKKQVSSSISKSCDRVDPTWRSLSQLVTLLQPYLPSSSHSAAVDTCKELQALVNITQKM